MIHPRLLLLLTLSLATGAAAQPGPGGGRGPGAFMRAPLFISPMGEPFRAATGPAGLELWYSGADRDSDGALTVAEMRLDADRFFSSLDVDRDGELGPVEITRYENEIAPQIRLGGLGDARGGGMGRRRGGWSGTGGGGGGRPGGARGRRPPGAGSRPGFGDETGLQGAGRFGLINMPEPVMDADSDFNRGVARAEFAAAAGRRFFSLDMDHDGRLARAELLSKLPDPPAPRKRKRRRR